ncbi:unnamed protein product [Miscanthus lutarioriparius]|uniref:BRX domain-containing protein n=1 Tax=Miscanthus lutarioriparius TaxID=422564 RepID=A0A811R5D5_9POAL|nr:unnamed protein product [Miscanthus lutarioriparius]
MLTCIACSKHLPGGAPPLREPPEDDNDDNDDHAIAGGGGESATTPGTRQAVKSLTAQIKDMALKASGAYRHCKPCAGSSSPAASRRQQPYYHGAFAESGSDRFHYAYQRAGSSAASTPRLRTGGAMSSGDVTPSVSARTDFLAGDEDGDDEEETAAGSSEEDEAKEWVAQVEPGVLITFLSLPRGGNGLKRIRFSREMFNKWQAQRWWTENYEKVMELYNVQKFNSQAAPLPSIPRSENESSKDDNPATAPLNKGQLLHTLHRPLKGSGAIGYSSSDCLQHQPNHLGNVYHQDRYLGHQCCDSVGLASTPKLSSISGAKTETSIDASVRTSSSPEEVDRSGELSAYVSNASDQEREWVEEDEPGVYITIRALPGGIGELRRVRFRFAVFCL